MVFVVRPLRLISPVLPLTISLVLFFVALPQLSQWLIGYQQIALAVPWILGALLLILSQLFNQGRIGHMAMLVLLSFVAMQWFIQNPMRDLAHYWLFFWLTLLWPLNVLLIRWLPEFRPWSIGALTWPLLLAVQLSIVLIIPRSPLFPEIYQWLQSWQQQPSSGWLPMPAWVSFSLGTGLLLTKMPRQTTVIWAMLGVMLLHACAFFSAAQGWAPLLAATLSLCLLLVALFICNHQLAFIDELTGIPGRRALLNDLHHRHGQYVLVMADIDHFKSFNDTHGHDVGDDVLRLVASQLQQVGAGGRAYRYGGEEFTLLFGSSDLKAVTAEVNRLRERIAEYPLVVRNNAERPKNAKDGKKQRASGATSNKVLHVTMSFGAALRSSGEESMALMKRADQALYKAKQNGRNRVEQAR